MSDDARDVLRLRRCPECGYDLSGLPADHRCPECGFDYDRSMFAIPAWRPGWRRRSRDWETAIYGGLTIGPGLYLFYWGMQTTVLGLLVRLAAWVVIWLLTIVCIAVAKDCANRRRLRDGRGDMTVTFDADGFVVDQPRKKRTRRTWDQFKDVRVRRARGMRWKLRLRPHSIVDPPFAFTAVITGPRREIARLRAELRRRIRAANRRI